MDRNRKGRDGGVLDAVRQGEPGVLKMEPALIKAACDRAHALGLKVAAHVESPVDLTVCVDGEIFKSKSVDIEIIPASLPFHIPAAE